MMEFILALSIGLPLTVCALQLMRIAEAIEVLGADQRMFHGTRVVLIKEDAERKEAEK